VALVRRTEAAEAQTGALALAPAPGCGRPQGASPASHARRGTGSLRAALAVFSLVAALSGTSGCYSPDVKECSISCGSGGSCPSGTSCLSDGFCHAQSTAALCGASGTPDARPGQPDAKAGQPDARPGEPDARPGQPDAKPGQPDARPGQPDAKPAEPDAPIPDAPVPDAPSPDAPAGEPDAPGPDAGCTPILENIDTEGTPGYTNVGLTFDGTLHTTYVRTSTSELWHAYKAPGGAWHREKVDSASGELKGQALDLLGGVHVSYRTQTTGGPTLRYAHLSMLGGWHSELVTDNGEPTESTLAIDGLGTVEIAYHDATYDTLERAERGLTDFSWGFDTVDDAAAVGAQPSIGISPANGDIFVSYRDIDHTSLKVARFTANAWTSDTLDNAGDTGVYSALAVDLGGSVHVAYGDNTAGTARYLLIEPGTASPIKLPADSTKGTGHWNSIGVDTGGGVHIATHFSVDNDLRFAYRPTSGSFAATTVDSGGSVGRQTSLVVDSSGGTHITYVDDSHGAIKHAYVCPPR
jgi:hypothetical protein